MRVIAGQFRSRQLVAPRGLATRPTSDRLRETLFNVIASRVPEARFADLYAGSGAVGVEAISRGAQDVYFAENNPAALTAIRDNLRSLGVHAGVQIEAGGTATLLKWLPRASLDLVFLDPPYEDSEEYRRTLLALGGGNGPLHPASMVIAEHSRKETLLHRYGGLRSTRTLLQGDAALTFFQLAADTE